MIALLVCLSVAVLIVIDWFVRVKARVAEVSPLGVQRLIKLDRQSMWLLGGASLLLATGTISVAMRLIISGTTFGAGSIPGLEGGLGAGASLLSLTYGIAVGCLWLGFVKRLRRISRGDGSPLIAGPRTS